MSLLRCSGCCPVWAAVLTLTNINTAGDIGTSPLYVISSTFTEAPPSPEDTLGLVSLIIWTLTAILVIKCAHLPAACAFNSVRQAVLPQAAAVGMSGVMKTSDEATKSLQVLHHRAACG